MRFHGANLCKKVNGHFATKFFTFSISPQYFKETIGRHSIVREFLKK